MSFDASEYDMLNDEIYECISLKCAKGSCYYDHCFNIDDMESALTDLKQNKVDGLETTVQIIFYLEVKDYILCCCYFVIVFYIMVLFLSSF